MNMILHYKYIVKFNSTWRNTEGTCGTPKAYNHTGGLWYMDFAELVDLLQHLDYERD